MKKLEPGQEITAEIVAITNDCIFIDLNEKSEGVLDRAELNNDKGECTVKEGEKIKVFFLGEKGGEMR
ncbi:MAG: S1 RNA-binding domain-containing protein, partial [Spirochaetaceae bacterium]|nr:S1 RNA-binding domain-containing protein [Spirochaetaceae bacterium]